MKRYIFFLLWIMLSNITNIIATNNNNNQEYIITDENGEKSFTSYASYFIIKEICKSFLNAPFMDHKKIKQASIYCNTCNHKNDAEWLWVSLILKFNHDPITELKNHIYNDSAEELATYILQKSQELQQNCPQCGKYNGYYIPEQFATQD